MCDSIGYQGGVSDPSNLRDNVVLHAGNPTLGLIVRRHWPYTANITHAKSLTTSFLSGLSRIGRVLTVCRPAFALENPAILPLS